MPDLLDLTISMHGRAFVAGLGGFEIKGLAADGARN